MSASDAGVATAVHSCLAKLTWPGVRSAQLMRIFVLLTVLLPATTTAGVTAGVTAGAIAGVTAGVTAGVATTGVATVGTVVGVVVCSVLTFLLALLMPWRSRRVEQLRQYHLALVWTKLSSIFGSWHHWCQGVSQLSQKTMAFTDVKARRVQYLHIASLSRRLPEWLRFLLSESIMAGLYVMASLKAASLATRTRR